MTAPVGGMSVERFSAQSALMLGVGGIAALVFSLTGWGVFASVADAVIVIGQVEAETQHQVVEQCAASFTRAHRLASLSENRCRSRVARRAAHRGQRVDVPRAPQNSPPGSRYGSVLATATNCASSSIGRV